MKTPDSLLARLLAAAPTWAQSTLSVALVLLLRAPDAHREFPCYYDDLAVRSCSSRGVVERALTELERSAVIARERKLTKTGHALGPKNPYVFRFLEPQAVEPGAEEPGWRWSELIEALPAALDRIALYQLDPSAVSIYARTAALADADGRLTLTRAELGARVCVADGRTVVKHLDALERAGVLAVAVTAGRPQRVTVSFTRPRPLDRRERGQLVGRICLAHQKTKARRSRRQRTLEQQHQEERFWGAYAAEAEAEAELRRRFGFGRAAAAKSARSRTLPVAANAVADVTLYVELQRVRGGSLLVEIVKRTEREQCRRFTPEEVNVLFVAPVLAAQERHAAADGLTETILKRVRERRPMPANFASYFTTACENELARHGVTRKSRSRPAETGRRA